MVARMAWASRNGSQGSARLAERMQAAEAAVAAASRVLAQPRGARSAAAAEAAGGAMVCAARALKDEVGEARSLAVAS